jgi:methionyl-tRNA formyltransferase
MASHPPPSASSVAAKPLQIVFMGTPALAARILERLVAASGEHLTVAGVVTRPDQPRRRGLKLEPSEVGAVAERHQLKTLKPLKIRTTEFLEELKALDPDVIVVAAYGRILPNPVLAAARIMPINVHASLLPRHRGASPVEGAILCGDAESGATIMRITERMDAGPILLQRRIELATRETQGSLKEKIAEAGFEALIESLELLREGKLEETPQDDNLATYTSPVTKEHAVIDWDTSAVQIERTVRAYDPWPVARTRLRGEDLLVWRAGIAELRGDGSELRAPPGTLVRLKPEPVVKCGDGLLTLVEVQAPGRRRMPAVDFFRGRRIASGAQLGEPRDEPAS